MNSDKLKIRWVTWFPTPYFVDRFTALAQRPEVEFEALFLAAGSMVQDWSLPEADWGFRYEIVNRQTSTMGYGRPNRSLRGIWPILRRSNGITLVLNYADASAIVAGTAARLAGRSFHLFVANTEADARPGGVVREGAKRYMFGRARGVLATGPLQERYARRYVAEHLPVHLIGNPVNTSYFRDQARRLALQRERLRSDRGWSSSFVVAYVGRLAPEKSLDVLIASTSRAREQGIPAVLAIAGTGAEEQQLRLAAEGAGLRADFLGFLQGEELCQLYTAADVFALPSRSEPWGLVVNEALEFGLPVVVSDRVGCQHLLEGDNGFIVGHGDQEGLSSVFVRLARDNTLRASVGANGRSRIRTETIESWVDAVVTALRP